ncbi:MAG TPA: hypothetical protein VMA53_18915, partial [Stellaceae bacterium]|nr:hypothetical protein [Stellaceae bacterium]
ASGIPAIVSRAPPFTEYLAEDECLWVEPSSVTEIAAAMLAAGEEAVRRRLVASGLQVCRRHSWAASARDHQDIYAEWLCSSREAADA